MIVNMYVGSKDGEMEGVSFLNHCNSAIYIVNQRPSVNPFFSANGASKNSSGIEHIDIFMNARIHLCKARAVTFYGS